MTHERHVMDMPIRVSSVDILTIGAGGGSIGWFDAAGQFRVGPQSAGATPGPACYNGGGEEPTVTDANLVLGVLGPEQRLGGEVALNNDLAHKACEKLGRRLGMGAQEVAWGIRRIVNAAMAGATRAVSVGRGYDPRDFSLIAFGGAGPMHAVDIAAELEIPKVLVPAIPGCLSAFGLVVSDVTHDYVMTHLAPISDTLHLQLERIFAEFAAGAHAQLADEGIEEKRCELFRILDLRYIGEQSSVSVPVAANDADWLAATTQEFHAMHERLYGFCVLDEPVEVVNVRMRAVGRLYRPPRNGAAKPASATRSPQRIGTRMVAFGPNKGDRVETPVYERTALVPGTSFTGPAIVEQNDSTLIVPAKRIVRTDEHSNLLIEAGSREHQQSRPNHVGGSALRSHQCCRGDEGRGGTHRLFDLWKEAGDLSCGLLTSSSELAVQGIGDIPVHLASMPMSLGACLKRIPPETLKPGDVVYQNDPYQGNNHLPDFIMAKPIFFSGQIVGYSAVRGHYVDVGGGGPGSYSATMPDIYAEGLRIPPVRIYEEGKINRTSSTYSCTTRAIRANAMAICVRNMRAVSRQSGASSASARVRARDLPGGDGTNRRCR